RLQHLPVRVRLHGVAGLQRIARRQRGELTEPAIELPPVVEIERRSDLVGEAGERVGRGVERRHGRELSQSWPTDQARPSVGYPTSCAVPTRRAPTSAWDASPWSGAAAPR